MWLVLVSWSRMVVVTQGIWLLITHLLLGAVQTTGTLVVDWTRCIGPHSYMLGGAHFPVDEGGVATSRGCPAGNRRQPWDGWDARHWRLSWGGVASVGLGWEGVTARVGGGNQRGNAYRWCHSEAITETNWACVETLDLWQRNNNAFKNNSDMSSLTH